MGVMVVREGRGGVVEWSGVVVARAAARYISHRARDFFLGA